MRSIQLLVFCACFGVLTLFGQADANKAQIVGTVFDPNGSVVQNAELSIRNINTGFTRNLTSTGDGTFRIVQLDPGEYELTAKSAGFSETKLMGIMLSVGSAANLEVRLSVQATVTTVEVSDTMMSTVTPQPSTLISREAIRDLPINGRRFQDFATLTPSVQVDPSRGQLSFVGQRGINSNIMVDGADYNQPFFGGIRGGERSNFNFTLPQSAVQEFQAVTTGYAAEYGRSTGGVLNVITRGGTNEVHGDLFYQNRDRSLSADNPIFNVQPSESLQQFGGSIGGPLRRDKLFLFGAYEHQLADTPSQVLFTPLTGFTPNAASQEAFNYFRSEEGPFTRENRALAATLRTDYQFEDGSRLTLRYNVSDSEEPNSVTVGGALNPFTNQALSNEGTEKNRTHFGTAQWTKLLNPSVVNDLKFSGSYENRPRLSNSAIPTVTAGSPAIGTFGARNFLPTVQDDTRWQITDGITANIGKHTFKAGFDVNLLSTFQAFGFNQYGAFNVAGSNTQTVLDILGTDGAFPNRFDSRDVTYNRQVGNLVADYGMKQVAFFAQDSWRLAPSFTLDFGVRWEAQFNPKVDLNNQELVSRVQGQVVPNGARIDIAGIRNAVDQWMPRVGFAWSPMAGSRRLVVRGHTGLFYAASPMIVFSAATNNFRLPAGDVSLQLAPTATQTVYQQLLAAGVDLNQYSLGTLPVIPIETVQRASALALGGAARDPFVGANLTFMASDFRNPRSVQAGLGMEMELTSNWTAGVQLNYVNTAWLTRNRDYNLPFPTVRPTDGSGRSFYGLRSGARRPIPLQGQLTVRESSARAMYRGGTLSTQYRTSRFTLGANYTLSETFSDDDSERDAGGTTYNDNFNFRRDYNYSVMDARHQVNTYGLVQLPWGFEVSGIFRFRTGLPWNPLTGADSNEDLFNTDRPMAAPGIVMERNSFRNRNVILNNDIRLLKAIRLGERFRIQLSAEIFNVFDVDNVVFAGQTNIYGVGINAAGQTVTRDSRFMRLRNDDETYFNQNRQQGNPLQAQFGIRFLF